MGMFTPGKIIALLILALAFAGISSLSVQSVDAPDISYDGLHLEPDSKLALLYVKPDADFSVYSHFLMLDAYVAFKKNWQCKTRVAGRRFSNNDVERIKADAAHMFKRWASLLRQGMDEVREEAGLKPVKGP